jgi:hypothetical protein
VGQLEAHLGRGTEAGQHHVLLETRD